MEINVNKIISDIKQDAQTWQSIGSVKEKQKLDIQVDQEGQTTEVRPVSAGKIEGIARFARNLFGTTAIIAAEPTVQWIKSSQVRTREHLQALTNVTQAPTADAATLKSSLEALNTLKKNIQQAHQGLENLKITYAGRETQEGMSIAELIAQEQTALEKEVLKEIEGLITSLGKKLHPDQGVDTSKALESMQKTVEETAEAKRLKKMDYVTKELYTTAITFNEDISAFAAKFKELAAKEGKIDPVLSYLSQSLNHLKELDDEIVKDFERINVMSSDQKHAAFDALFRSQKYTDYLEAHGRFVLLLGEIPLEQRNLYKSQIDTLPGPALRHQDISVLQLRSQKFPLIEDEMIKLVKPGDAVPINYSRAYLLSLNEQRRTIENLNEFHAAAQKISRSKEEIDVFVNLHAITRLPIDQRNNALVNFFRSPEFNATLDSLVREYNNPNTSNELKEALKSYFQGAHTLMKGVGFGETIKSDLPASITTLSALTR